MIKFEGDSYETGPRRVSLFARAFPSFTFYRNVIDIVVRASRKAKRRRYDTAEWCSSSLEVLRALEYAGVALEVTGMSSFKETDGPCVFIGNHMSTLETFVLPTIIAPFKEATFIVKQSLVDYPVFRHVMRSRDPVVVGRANPRDDLKAVLEGGTDRLKAGVSIIIFPQTTRTPVFDPEQFNTIGIKLAKKAGVPVVPVALKTDAWGNGALFKDFGKIDPSKKVRIAFGKPLPVKGRGAEEHQEVIAFIREKLEEWEAEDREGKS
ncbi:MAG TPA: lysophospholipid acyltransferase family protein [Nitrospirota bacterium]